jgi:hypothetical protein
LKKKELAVGDSTDVEIIFSTGHYSSRVNKSASVICNAPGAGSALSIIAHPIKDPDSLTTYTFTPYQIDMDASRPDAQKKPWEYEVAVRNVSAEPLALTVVSRPDRFVEVEVPNGEIKPGKEKTIRIRIEPEVADTLFTKSFTVEASDSARTRFTFPIKKSMRWGPAPTSSR